MNLVLPLLLLAAARKRKTKVQLHAGKSYRVRALIVHASQAIDDAFLSEFARGLRLGGAKAIDYRPPPPAFEYSFTATRNGILELDKDVQLSTAPGHFAVVRFAWVYPIGDLWA